MLFYYFFILSKAFSPFAQLFSVHFEENLNLFPRFNDAASCKDAVLDTDDDDDDGRHYRCNRIAIQQ